MIWQSTAGQAVVVTLLGALLSACGDGLYVGTDVVWTARHEGGDLSEWTSLPGGSAVAVAPNLIQISNLQAHEGKGSARLTITTAVAGVQESAGLSRTSGLPLESYYSAWYYLPQYVSVGTFWVIMKFRQRGVATDPSTSRELFDLDLRSLPGGVMSLRLFDHRRGGDLPLAVSDPPVPIGRWFHLEAFYRNAQDTTGRLTYWLDGREVADVSGQAMAATPWVGWVAGSTGLNLAPSTAELFVDDAAISRTRVGPDGTIGR